MEGELATLAKVSLSATAALCYCYFLASRIPHGKWRLLCLLPVFFLFIRLPLSFTTVHLRGISGFFLAWLSIFKLLLFALARGPLCNDHLSLPAFLATASLPVKIQEEQKQQQQSKFNKATTPQIEKRKITVPPLLGFAVKGLLLALLINHYPQRHRYHRLFVLALYAIHMYLALDIVLACAAALSRAFLGRELELEPQFSAPYFTTSLQDFWGRRWNLMVTRLLHPAVYTPLRPLFGTFPAVIAVFLVSGLMHEVMFYYLTLCDPTGEVTCFFLLQGVCTALEVKAKGMLSRRGWRPLPVVAAAPLILGFVWGTGLWLFFPPVLGSDVEEQVIRECTVVLEAGKWAVGKGLGLLL